jgi:hypothetical protein
VHAPPLQLSAFVGSHVVQLPPAAPHVVVDAVLHVPDASQQPVGQLVALQAHLPPTHC